MSGVPWIEGERLAHGNAAHPGIALPAETLAQVGGALIDPEVFQIGRQQALGQYCEIGVIRSAVIIKPAAQPLESIGYFA